LQKELHALYVLSGDEPLALMECTDALRAAASSRGHHERSVLLAERNFNWEQLVASGQAMSLFSDKKLTELRIPSGKPGTEGGKALQAMLPIYRLTP
jgi:DNA polymerase-3 subunit delta